MVLCQYSMWSQSRNPNLWEDVFKETIIKLHSNFLKLVNVYYKTYSKTQVLKNQVVFHIFLNLCNSKFYINIFMDFWYYN